MKIFLSDHVRTTGISPWRGTLCSVRVVLGPLASNLEGIFARIGFHHLGRLNLFRSTWYSSWRGMHVMVRQNWFICFIIFILFPHQLLLLWPVVSRLLICKLYGGWHCPQRVQLCRLRVPPLPLAWHNWQYIHKNISTCVYPAPRIVELSNFLSIHNFQVVVGCSVEDGLHNQSSGGDAPGLGDSGGESPT